MAVMWIDYIYRLFFGIDGNSVK